MYPRPTPVEERWGGGYSCSVCSGEVDQHGNCYECDRSEPVKIKAAEPVKIKTTKVKDTRLTLLEQQGYRCAICAQELAEDKAVLDHDHKGGHVRAVLHRDCNIMLGKVENASVRTGMGKERMIQFLQGAAKYIIDHTENRSGLIHPSHFTPEEKIERRKAKAKRTRAKVKKAKLKA
jgi:hypothetical protein